jgi:hypothetical protein
VTVVVAVAFAVGFGLARMPDARSALTTYTGAVNSAGTASAYRTVNVPVDGTLAASLDWDQAGANLVLSLSRRNPDGTWTWIMTATGHKPETISYPVTAGAWRLGVKAKSGAANYTLSVSTPDGPPDNAYVTLLFSRSEITAADNCVPNDLGVVRLDTGVAPEFARRHITGTGTVETGVTADNSDVCLHSKSTMAASWNELAQLRDTYGWSFVSHSRTYAKNWSTMTRDQQWSESCGSIQDLLAHGHTRGDGMFAYPHNTWTDDVQINVVSTCFAFARRFGTGPATRASVTTSPYYARTQQVGGGRCADSALACSTLNAPSIYKSPDTLRASLAALTPGQWYIIQGYVFVTGSRPGHWDCTSSDWRGHWTMDYERYCWSDYLRVLDAIPPAAIVTDPKTVAQAWGRTGYTPPPAP